MSEITPLRNFIQRKSIPDWLASFLAAVAIGIGGWAHAILWSHDQKITQNTADIINLEKQTTEATKATERHLDRIDDKMDQLRTLIESIKK